MRETLKILWQMVAAVLTAMAILAISLPFGERKDGAPARTLPEGASATSGYAPASSAPIDAH